MRIVGGRHRGRRLEAPDGSGLRPTADRVRESLFNVLAHRHLDGFEGLWVADLFCGTGALALEALSRGAGHAILVDSDPEALAVARRNVEALDETERTTLLRNDATRRLPHPSRPIDLCFVDPPYRQGLATPALTALRDAEWLAPDALVLVELARKEQFDPPAGFAVVDERRWGSTRVVFLEPSG